MAVYIKVVATALIKIQDPYDAKDIRKAEEDTVFSCPHELCDEDYKFEVVDAD
jgi:hypothetical protein